MNLRSFLLTATAAVALVACPGPTSETPTTPAPPTPPPPTGTRLLEVTIDLRSTTAEALLFEPGARRGASAQAVTTLPSSNTALELEKTAVGWNDDDTENVRYFYATFRVDNNTAQTLRNLTAWSLDVPVASGAISQPTLFGTAFSSVKDGTGVEITDGSLIRAIEPVHTMRPVLSKVKIDRKLADLQILTSNERNEVDAQLSATYGLTGGSTLGYGFVGRSVNGNNREIGATNGTPGAADSCTLNTCKGFITFAFKVALAPLNSVPREQRPAVFKFVSAIGDQGVTSSTQSLDEQNDPTIAGIPQGNAAFADIGVPRLLAGSSTTFFDNPKSPQNICQVRTANASGTFNDPVLMPPSLDLTPGKRDTCMGSGGLLSITAEDASFNNASAAVLDSQGRLVVVGTHSENGNNNMVIYRLEKDRLDASFNNGAGFQTINLGGSEVADGVALDTAGKIIVVGTGQIFDAIVVARLLEDGTFDTGFGSGGKMAIFNPTVPFKASGVSVQGNNIFVSGTAGASPNREFLVAKVSNFGALDTTFGTNGLKQFHIDGNADDVSTGIATTASNIFVVGSRESSGATDWAVAKLEIINGDINNRVFFDVNNQEASGVFAEDDEASAIAVDANGKLVIAGSNTSFAGVTSDFVVARMTSGLAFDPNFGLDGDGITISGLGGKDIATSLALNADGSIIVGGYTDANGSNDFAARKFSATGVSSTLYGPTDFNDNTDSDLATATVIDSAGRVVLIGSYSSGSVPFDIGLTWLNP